MPSANLPIPDADAHVAYDVTTATTGPFAIPFPLPLDGVAALRCAVDGELVTMFTFTPDSSVAGGYPSGEAVLDTAVESATVEFWRDTPITRTSDYGQGPLDFDTLNAELARLTMQVQDVRLVAQALSALSDELLALYAIRVSISNLAAVSGAVAALGPIAGAISGVDAISGSVTAVAGNAANINIVAGMAGDISAILGYGDDLSTIADAVELVIDGALIPADIGVTVQGYDADTAKTDVAQTWSAAQTYFRQTISTSAPILRMSDTSQSAGQRNWDITSYSNVFRIRALADDWSSGLDAMQVARGAGHTIVSVNFPNGTLQAGGNTVLTTATGAQLSAANTFTNQQVISSELPRLVLSESDQGADAKAFGFDVSAGAFRLRLYNDALSATAIVFALSRSGMTPLVAEFDAVDLRIEPTPASLSVNSAGFRSAGPDNVKTGNHTFVATDEGCACDANSSSPLAFTINTGVHTTNAILFGVNRNSGTMTLTRGSGITFSDGSQSNANLSVTAGKQWSARRRGSTNTWDVRAY